MIDLICPRGLGMQPSITRITQRRKRSRRVPGNVEGVFSYFFFFFYIIVPRYRRYVIARQQQQQQQRIINPRSAWMALFFLGTPWLALAPDARRVCLHDRDAMPPHKYTTEVFVFTGALGAPDPLPPAPSVSWISRYSPLIFTFSKEINNASSLSIEVRPRLIEKKK